jgi:hypothetical protein
VTSKSYAPGQRVTGGQVTGRTTAAGAGMLRVEPAEGQPFTGELQPLNRIATVQPDTVAAVFAPSQPVALRYAGDTLMPSWRPFRAPAQVLAVNVARIPLRATVSSLTTFDDHAVDEVTLRLTVQLAEHNGYAVVLGLIERHGPRFGTYLLEELQARIESAVRGAFRLNNLSVLRRALAAILEERWLPPTFADGALLRRSMSVLEVRWPSSQPSAAPTAQTASDPEPTINQFEVSMDARLRRIWAAQCPAQLAGIAGAKVDGEATVVAATEQRPDPGALQVLREAYAELYDDPSLVLAVTGTRDYADIVRGWLEAVDQRHVTLLGVDVVRSRDALRIHLGSALARAAFATRGRPSATGSEAEALRRLLPHRQVEFEALAER